jgi:membrane associated rhomboid family serine protease
MLGILTSPFLHGDTNHLGANSMPLLILGTLILYFYPTAATRVILGIYFISGLAVWLLARPVTHIGASGLVYGFAFFLFFSGVFRNDMKSLAISFFIIFMYGGIVWGLMPNLIGISWESHLFGAIAGSLLAYAFRTVDLPPKPQWYMEEESQPEISYRYIYVPKDKPGDPAPPQEENKPATDEKGTDQNP